MRLFVSADVDGLAEKIAAVQRPFADAAGLRLTDPQQAHITLQFLGDTRSEQLPDLREAVRTAVADSGLGPFRTELGGLGVFPGLEYISVVWLGVHEGSEQLTALHERVESQTTALGLDPEEHVFTPHVTLARMDHAGDKKRVQELVETCDPTAGTLTLDTVCLTESTLTADGPVYETVEQFDLPG
jgi:2'-5' RNA ligase